MPLATSSPHDPPDEYSETRSCKHYKVHNLGLAKGPQKMSPKIAMVFLGPDNSFPGMGACSPRLLRLNMHREDISWQSFRACVLGSENPERSEHMKAWRKIRAKLLDNGGVGLSERVITVKNYTKLDFLEVTPYLVESYVIHLSEAPYQVTNVISELLPVKVAASEYETTCSH